MATSWSIYGHSTRDVGDAGSVAPGPHAFEHFRALYDAGPMADPGPADLLP